MDLHFINCLPIQVKMKVRGKKNAFFAKKASQLSERCVCVVLCCVVIPLPSCNRSFRCSRYTLYPPSDPTTDHAHLLESKASAKQMSPFAAVQPQDVRQLKHAAELIKKKDFRSAFQELNALIDLYPGVARLYTLRAMCATKQKGHQAALKDAKKAMELDPTETQAYCTP